MSDLATRVEQDSAYAQRIADGFCDGPLARADGLHCEHWWDGDKPCCCCCDNTPPDDDEVTL